jgi:DNA-binding beta-propeller fold protein YncE
MNNLMRIYRLLCACLAPLAAACADIERPPLLPYLISSSASSGIGILSSDLGGAGNFVTMSLEGVPRIGQRSTHSDAVLRYQDNRVYVINRLGRDNIQVLNPDLLYATEREFSVGTGANPHDFVKINDGKAFVTLYERGSLLIVNPSTGAQTGTINFAPFADSDGFPEMSGMFKYGSRVFVAVQRLNRNATVGVFPPTGSSSLVEIDADNDGIIAEHLMPATNPFGALEQVDLFGQPHIIIAAPAGIGANADLAGGVVAYNLTAGVFRGGFVYSESTAGGDILDVVIKNDSVGYANVQFPDNSKEIQRFDPTTGQKTASLGFLASSGGFVAGLLLASNGKLYVADSSFNRPGITIFDTNAGDFKINGTPIDVGLRPVDLVFLP